MSRWLLLALLAIGVVVLTDTSLRRRKIMRRVADRVENAGRFVDVGVRLHTVVADPGGEELITGRPRVRVIATEHLGGIIDTQSTPARIIGPSRAPRDWYASPEQVAIILHGDAEKLGQLVYGSEGAGKTHVLAMWHYWRWLNVIGQKREGGQTAPTEGRLHHVREAMFQLYAPSWYRYLNEPRRFIMCDGTRIQLVSTFRQSKAQGSPVQGFNWSWAGRDELQDQGDAHNDIESRGRSAMHGQYWQLATATAKDDSEWRELRDSLIASGKWERRELSIFRSPFIHPSFIENKKATLSDREFRRRYGDPKTGTVADLPPMLAVYFGWLRDRNLTHIPRIARDVTAAILSGYRSYTRPGAALTLLCAHDPGVIYNTTEILRLLVFPADRIVDGRKVTELVPTWAVVGELQTNQTTAREHALALKAKLQNEYGIDLEPSRYDRELPPKACIFVDPHGKGEGDTDYQSVYMAFQGVGLDVFNPAPMTGRIRRSVRIEMVNRLLGGSVDSNGTPRLVVCKDDRGNVLAPKLVEAFESLRKNPGEKDPEGSQKKDARDKTHAPAALAYGLIPFEQEAFTADTVRRAIAEARRNG